MKKYFLVSCIVTLCQLAFALESHAGGMIEVNSNSISRVVTLFKQISGLASPPGTSAGKTTCGYIFPNDPNKFGCKGSGRAAADVAAACSGGGQLACTGSGSQRTCTCAFD